MKRLFFICLWVIGLELGCQQTRVRNEALEYEEGSKETAWEYRRLSDGFSSFSKPKEKIFVFPFWNATPLQEIEIQEMPLEEFIAEEFKRGLRLTRRVLIAGAATSLKTVHFMTGSQIDWAQLQTEGKRLGASLVIIGKVKNIFLRHSADEVGFLKKNHSSVTVELEMKLFDLHAGREALSRMAVGEVTQSQLGVLEKLWSQQVMRRNEAIGTAVQEAIASFLKDVVSLAQKKKWQGRIVKREGAVLYINAGEDSGLTLGDILKVSTLGEELFDPVTGASLGRTPGLLKGTLRIIGFTSLDGSYAKIHTGEGFQEGDLVELY